MQNIMPPSLGKTVLSLWFGWTHYSSWFPLIRAAQETCDAAVAPNAFPPACEVEGGAGLFASRMSWPPWQSTDLGSQDIVSSPTRPMLPVLLLPPMYWFPLTPQEGQAHSSIAYNLSRKISFFFFLLCLRFSIFATPWAAASPSGKQVAFILQEFK